MTDLSPTVLLHASSALMSSPAVDGPTPPMFRPLLSSPHSWLNNGSLGCVACRTEIAVSTRGCYVGVCAQFPHGLVGILSVGQREQLELGVSEILEVLGVDVVPRLRAVRPADPGIPVDDDVVAGRGGLRIGPSVRHRWYGLVRRDRSLGGGDCGQRQSGSGEEREDGAHSAKYGMPYLPPNQRSSEEPSLAHPPGLRDPVTPVQRAFLILTVTAGEEPPALTATIWTLYFFLGLSFLIFFFVAETLTHLPYFLPPLVQRILYESAPATDSQVTVALFALRLTFTPVTLPGATGAFPGATAAVQDAVAGLGSTLPAESLARTAQGVATVGHCDGHRRWTGGETGAVEAAFEGGRRAGIGGGEGEGRRRTRHLLLGDRCVGRHQGVDRGQRRIGVKPAARRHGVTTGVRVQVGDRIHGREQCLPQLAHRRGRFQSCQQCGCTGDVRRRHGGAFEVLVVVGVLRADRRHALERDVIEPHAVRASRRCGCS